MSHTGEMLWGTNSVGPPQHLCVLRVISQNPLLRGQG